jgi:hypothetical protein
MEPVAAQPERTRPAERVAPAEHLTPAAAAAPAAAAPAIASAAEAEAPGSRDFHARALVPLPVPLPPTVRPPMAPPPGPRPPNRPATDGGPAEHHDGDPSERGATGPQLRRFIKSRAYVPMHELRRRFLINGGDDEVTPVDLGERRRVFVGLPEREGHLLGELLRGGDIGYELSLDPISPIVVGVYPMRPVTRA